jgi:Acyl-CoA dehydrogenase, C-terminal domain
VTRTVDPPTGLGTVSQACPSRRSDQRPCAPRRAIPDNQDRTADKRAEFVLTSGRLLGHLPAETARTSRSFTIFEGTSEIQRVIISRAATGLDVR